MQCKGRSDLVPGPETGASSNALNKKGRSVMLWPFRFNRSEIYRRRFLPLFFFLPPRLAGFFLAGRRLPREGLERRDALFFLAAFFFLAGFFAAFVFFLAGFFAAGLGAPPLLVAAGRAGGDGALSPTISSSSSPDEPAGSLNSSSSSSSSSYSS